MLTEHGSTPLDSLSTEMDEFDLPPQPTISAPHTKKTYPASLLRKRTLDEYNDDDPATSSDPAVFSSDEQAPGAENYTGTVKRKKKMYAGSWWNHRVKVDKAAKRKRSFKRNFDSGIFMGSDSSSGGENTTLSSDSIGIEEELIRDQKREEEQRRGERGSGRWTGALRQRGPVVVVSPRKQTVHKESEVDHARSIIRRCLEEGQEDVDLSSMSLSTLPPEITDLATLTKQANLVPGMLDTGTSLEAQLRLFLANNLFTQVPRQILNLSNLRVLSLRRNNLKFIPPGIRSLVNLEFLNLSCNNLQFLPFEILELVRFHRLRIITTEPNPWVKPPRDNDQAVHSVDFTDSKGKLLPMARDAMTELTTYSQPTPIPSLTESVLRKLNTLEPKDDLKSFMPAETPENVLNYLDIQRISQDEGGRRCSVCKRPIVLPGAQWLEWWTLGPRPSLSTLQQNDSIVLSLYVTNVSFPVKRMKCWSGCSDPEQDWVESST